MKDYVCGPMTGNWGGVWETHIVYVEDGILKACPDIVEETKLCGNPKSFGNKS